MKGLDSYQCTVIDPLRARKTSAHDFCESTSWESPVNRQKSRTSLFKKRIRTPHLIDRRIWLTKFKDDSINYEVSRCKKLWIIEWILPLAYRKVRFFNFIVYLLLIYEVY